jgi:hypothetical protein
LLFIAKGTIRGREQNSRSHAGEQSDGKKCL